MLPSWSRTPLERIARQSVGIGTRVADGLADGVGVRDAEGEAPAASGPGVVPGSGTHPVSAAAITRTDAAAHASAVRRGAMRPR